MPLLALGKAAYERGDGPIVPLVNMLFEQDPRNFEDQVSLIQRPGQSLFATCGLGPIRTAFRQEGVLDGKFVVVGDTELYYVTTDGTVTQIGTTGDIPGTGRPSIAGSATAAYIATGTSLHRAEAGSVADVTFPDDAGVTSVGYLNGFFLFARAGTHNFYWLRPGETVIDALDFASAELSPDDLVGIAIVGDEVWLMGSNTTEVWDPTTDPDAPFQRIRGRLFPIGLTSQDTLAQVGGTLLWVGEDRYAGGRKVYRADGQPTLISEPWVEEKLRKADPANLRALRFGMEAHTCYALSTGNETLVVDLATNTWGTLKSHGSNEWRPSVAAARGDGLSIAGDTESGKLWLLDPDVHEDDGEPMEREWPGRIQLKAPQRCFNVILECTVGFADIADPDDDPMVSMCFSDDLAQTFTDWDAVSLGRQGEYDTLPAWVGGLGMMNRPGRDFRFRCTDNVRLTVRQAEYNGSLR